MPTIIFSNCACNRNIFLKVSSQLLEAVQQKVVLSTQVIKLKKTGDIKKSFFVIYHLSSRQNFSFCPNIQKYDLATIEPPRQVNEPLCLSKHNDVLRFGESPQPCCTLINPFRNNPTLAQHLLVHFLYHRNFYQYCQSFEGNSRSSTKVIERFSWLDDRWMILPLLPFGTQRFFLQFSVKTSTTSHLWIKN